MRKNAIVLCIITLMAISVAGASQARPFDSDNRYGRSEAKRHTHGDGFFQRHHHERKWRKREERRKYKKAQRRRAAILERRAYTRQWRDERAKRKAYRFESHRDWYRPHSKPRYRRDAWRDYRYDRPRYKRDRPYRRWALGRPIPRGVKWRQFKNWRHHRLPPPGRGRYYARVGDDILLVARFTNEVIRFAHYIGR